MDQSDKVVFKKKFAKRSLRSRDKDDDNEETDQKEKIEELKELQKLKKRSNKGINVIDLMNAPAVKSLEKREKITEIGGLTSAKNLTSELDLGNTFSVETNRRDEDADMMKYIEEELAKRKGDASEDGSGKVFAITKTSDDIVFEELPQHLLIQETKKSEEMLSSQMLSGIPEVDLGVDERIRNIEATEEAKVQLINKKRRGGRGTSNLVPTNVAVNFQQHNRFNVPDHETALATAAKKPRIVKPTVTIVEEPVVVIGDEPRQGKFKNYAPKTHGFVKFPGKEKATDDYHFERFRKQFRK